MLTHPEIPEDKNVVYLEVNGDGLLESIELLQNDEGLPAIRPFMKQKNEKHLIPSEEKREVAI